MSHGPWNRLSELLCFIHMIQITDEANSEHVPGHVQKADGVTEAFVVSTSSKDNCNSTICANLRFLFASLIIQKKVCVSGEKDGGLTLIVRLSSSGLCVSIDHLLFACCLEFVFCFFPLFLLLCYPGPSVVVFYVTHCLPLLRFPLV